MPTELLILIVLIFLSASFSGSEIALTSISRAKLKVMEDDRRFASRAIIRLKKYPQRLLIAILIGNQIVNIVATVLATILGIKLFGEEKLTLVTTLFAGTLIIFGTIGPKAVALRFSEVFSRLIAYPMLTFVMIMHPIVWIFEKSINAFFRLFKKDQEDIQFVDEKEVEAMFEIGAEEGIISRAEEQILKHIMDFKTAEVKGIMTLLKDIDCLDVGNTRDELLKHVIDSTHAYYPVCNKDLNDVRGIISVGDLIPDLLSKKKKYPLKTMKLLPLIIVPKTSSIIEMINTFKEKKQYMAIVVDEFGQTMGLVTLVDVLEAIAGGTLEKKRESEEPYIKLLSRNLWEASGEITVGEVNEELKVDLPFAGEQTMALLVLETLKRFPEEDEKVTIDRVEIEVKRVTKKQIEKIILRKKRKPKQS